MEHVKFRFEQAAKEVSSGYLRNVTQDEQLQLYALYSVVKKGVAPEKGPSAYLDPVGFAKWTAWSSVTFMSKEEAMEEYIRVVSTISNPNRTTSGDKTSNSDEGGFGNKGSTGFDITTSDDANYAMETEQKNEQDICYWATLGDVKQVEICLKVKQVSPDFRDAEGLTPLMRAADRNEAAVVDLLISFNAKVNLTDTEGQTALHYAAYCDHGEMAGLLTSCGASIDVKDNEGMTPMDAACPETRGVIESAKAGKFIRSSQRYTKALSMQHLIKTFSTYAGMDVHPVAAACAVGISAIVFAWWYRK